MESGLGEQGRTGSTGRNKKHSRHLEKIIWKPTTVEDAIFEEPDTLFLRRLTYWLLGLAD